MLFLPECAATRLSPRETPLTSALQNVRRKMELGDMFILVQENVETHTYEVASVIMSSWITHIVTELCMDFNFF